VLKNRIYNFFSHRTTLLFLLILFLAALVLRIVPVLNGMGIITSDEPHHVNLALNFGTGDLNPHVFKYPTLWMYLLFLVYGFVFVVWSGFGRIHSVADFACLYINDPGFFFTTARVVTIILGALCVLVAFKTGEKFKAKEIGLGAGLLLAVSPELVFLSSVAKPDMLMFFFSSFAWFFAAKFFMDGKSRDCILSGLSLGLAASSQYTAGLLLLPLVYLTHLGRCRWKFNWAMIMPKIILMGYGAVVLGFFIGTPFAFIDHKTFLSDIKDVKEFTSGGFVKQPHQVGLSVIGNLASFVGFTPLGIGLLALGAAFLFLKKRELLWFLLPPLAFGELILAFQTRPEVRYGLSLIPGLALLMAGSFGWGSESNRRANWVKIVICLGLLWAPGAQLLANLSQLKIKDPRIEAMYWIEKNIPEGCRLLMDQPHLSPPLIISPAQALRLYEKTLSLGNPRANYYKTLLQCGSDGKYEIFRIKHSYKALYSMKRHTEWSQEGYDLVDVDNGMQGVREAKIDYVVESDFGNDFNPEFVLSPFFIKLNQEAKLIAEFPSANYNVSPTIKIYKVSKPSK